MRTNIEGFFAKFTMNRRNLTNSLRRFLVGGLKPMFFRQSICAISSNYTYLVGWRLISCEWGGPNRWPKRTWALPGCWRWFWCFRPLHHQKRQRPHRHPTCFPSPRRNWKNMSGIKIGFKIVSLLSQNLLSFGKPSLSNINYLKKTVNNLSFLIIDYIDT